MKPLNVFDAVSNRDMDRKTTLIYGTIAGVATIGYYLLFYALDKPLFFHLGVYWSSLLIFIGLMLAAALRERKGIQGEYPWQQALRTMFGVFVVATALFQLFYYLFFNFGDAGLAAVQQEVLLENLERYKDRFGASATERLESATEISQLKYGIGTAFQSFARSVIGGFLLSLLLAFLVRKE